MELWPTLSAGLGWGDILRVEEHRLARRFLVAMRQTTTINFW